MKSIFGKIKKWVIDTPVWLIGYVKRRLLEQSTWLSIGAGVAGASALVAPWSYVSVGIAVIVALLPTSTADKGECSK